MREQVKATIQGEDEDGAEVAPAVYGCVTPLRGWAGAHLHGAVRPRRRSSGGRPPRRWC